MNTVKAWHFVGDTLRDGTPIPKDGEWLEIRGPIELCKRGLHASIHPFDALEYAPGSTLCRVELSGEIVFGDDKLAATKRRIIWRFDATEMLRHYACMQALSVIHLCDPCPPDIVLDYLMTGDEAIRDAAYWATVRGGVWDAACWATVRAAASAAAARDAVRAGARAAVRAAARAAPWAAAKAAARDAVWAAGWDPDAVLDAAVRDAARDEFKKLCAD